MSKGRGQRLILSAVGVGLVFIVGVAYLFAEVLDQPLTSRPDTLTVKLKNAGGLFEGSAVTYRGVKVGKVTEIYVTDVGVEAKVSMTTGTDVPKDSIAKVRSLSPVGEQYLDFQPNSPDGPFFEDGDTIEASSTVIPLSLASTVIAVNKVLEQIDDRKLRTLLVELSTGLEDTGDELGVIVDDGSELLAELDAVWPETQRLLRNGETVLDIGTDNRANLEELGSTAKELAAFLRGYDPELESMIERTPKRIKQLQALVTDARRILPDFLTTGVSLTDIFASYDPHLRALLQAYSPGLGALDKTIRDGVLHVYFIADEDPRCDYGNDRRNPHSPRREPLQPDGRCAASFSTLQRGAAHAPGPIRR